MATVVQWKAYDFCNEEEPGLTTNFTAQQLGGAGREDFSPKLSSSICKPGILILNSRVVLISSCTNDNYCC